MMNLIGSTKNKITKNKNSENASYLDIAELVLVHCNIFDNDYQWDWRVVYTFVSNKPFGQLLEISPTNLIFLETFTSEFQETEIWFTNQNSPPLEIEERINLTLVIEWHSYYKNASFSSTQRSNICKRYEFLSFAENTDKNLSNKYS